MKANKTLSPIVKINLSLVLLLQPTFKVPKTIRLSKTLLYHENTQ